MTCNQDSKCGAPHPEGESCYCPCHLSPDWARTPSRMYLTRKGKDLLTRKGIMLPMKSACGEYECPCHDELVKIKPAFNALWDALSEILETPGMLTEHSMRVQAKAAIRAAQKAVRPETT